MDFNAQFRRVGLTGELTLKPILGLSWPATSVKEEAIACMAAAGGDGSNHQLVLSESALQFG